MTDIALYIPSLRGGGAERAMLTVANGLADRGLGVDLVLVSAEGPYLREVSKDVRLVDLHSGRVLSSLPGLVRYLRKERPKALLSALNHANVMAIMARRLANVPTRLVVSERSTVSRAASQSQTLRQRCMLPLMRWSYRKADAVVAVSEGVADDLAFAISLPRARIDVIYNPVVTPDLETRAAEPVDHPWVGSEKPPVILAVGRLTPAKDYPTLIRAFAKVRSKHDCRLVILGEGELRVSLEALVSALGIDDSVQLPGFVENPFAWMRQASLFVLSSAWEGLPNVLIQAMACGTPVVSTDCPSGPREILEGGEWGVLVPVGNSTALAAAISAELEAPAQCNVRERAAHFDVDIALQSYINVLQGGST